MSVVFEKGVNILEICGNGRVPGKCSQIIEEKAQHARQPICPGIFADLRANVFAQFKDAFAGGEAAFKVLLGPWSAPVFVNQALNFVLVEPFYRNGDNEDNGLSSKGKEVRQKLRPVCRGDVLQNMDGDDKVKGSPQLLHRVRQQRIFLRLAQHIVGIAKKVGQQPLAPANIKDGELVIVRTVEVPDDLRCALQTDIGWKRHGFSCGFVGMQALEQGVVYGVRGEDLGGFEVRVGRGGVVGLEGLCCQMNMVIRMQGGHGSSLDLVCLRMRSIDGKLTGTPREEEEASYIPGWLCANPTRAWYTTQKPPRWGLF